MKIFSKKSLFLLLNVGLANNAWGAQCTDTQIRLYEKSCKTVETGFDTNLDAFDKYYGGYGAVESHTFYSCCKKDAIFPGALINTGIRYSYYDEWDGQVNGTFDVQTYHCKEQCP